MWNIAKYDRQKWVVFFTHLIVICMLFFLPEFMMNYTSAHRHPEIERMMYLKSAFFVGVFYLNYYLIINRTLFGRRQSYLWFVLWNLLIIVSFVAIFYFWIPSMWDTPIRHRPRHHEVSRMVIMIRQWSYILRDVGMLVLTIALSAALRFAEKWKYLEKRHEELLATQRTEELRNLKSQLNPHFLFNTLNTIYSLIDISPAEAQEAIHQLSKLLRHVLYENPAKQPLSQEVDFVETYISLMEKRIGSGVVKSDFSKIADSGLEVAPLIFVSLVENALKYGNTGNHDHQIEISVSSDSDGTVICRTFNHFVEGRHDNKDKGGIGLSNLRRRLDLIYGNDASLSTNVKGDTYEAILTIKSPSHKKC